MFLKGIVFYVFVLISSVSYFFFMCGRASRREIFQVVSNGRFRTVVGDVCCFQKNRAYEKNKKGFDLLYSFYFKERNVKKKKYFSTVVVFL